MNKVLKKFIKLTKDQELWPLLYHVSPFQQTSGWNTKKYFALYYKNQIPFYHLSLASQDESMAVFTKGKATHCAIEFLKNYLHERTLLRKINVKFYAHVQKIDKLYSQLDYKKVENSKIPDLIQKIINILKIIWQSNGLVFFSIGLDKEICQQVLIDSGIDLRKWDFDNFWYKATEPIFLNFEQEQDLFYLNLFIQNRSQEEIVELCQYFYTDYFNSQELPFVARKLKKRFKGMNRNKARSLLLKAEREKEHKVKIYLNWYQHLTEQQKIVADYIQNILKLRNDRKNFFAKALTIAFRVCQKMFTQVKLPHDLIRFYTFNEIGRGMGYLRKQVKILEKRKQGFLVLTDYGGKIVHSYVNYDSVKKDLDVHYLNNILARLPLRSGDQTIYGQIGCPGKAQGRVKIVLDVDKIKDFKKGNILISGMTRPEYLPLMKKAAAFVTDEGGITSHAAIVSRELGIPCIIGTKIATKVFKDGDLVEVDANKGIVRLVETKARRVRKIK